MNDSFDKLKSIIEENSDFVDVGTGARPEVIAKAETFLGVSFPDTLKLYLETWGTIAIGPLEYYGITGENFESSKVPDGVWFTSVQREALDLPRNFFVLFNNEGDELHCVDLETEEIKSWDTSQKEVVAIKSKNLFEYIAEEGSDFL